MKRTIALLIAGIICASFARAGDVKITLTITDSEVGEAKTTFPADIPKLYALFKTKGAKDGDKIRGTWIAIDVGDAAPPNAKIDERIFDAEGDTDDGLFSLGKPTNGWPVGKYRFEIYVNDKLATSVNFTIKGGRSKKDAADGEPSEE
jgi:hypothetical protein